MATHTGPSPVSIHLPFTGEEIRALEVVRIRFQQDHDILSARERARLSFLRWLARNGRLEL